MKRPTCDETLDRLPDWVAGRLGGAAAEAVQAHVAACARCAEELELVRLLHAGRPTVPAGLAERIAAAARTAPVAVASPQRRLRRFVPAWALSAAAVLALAIGTTVLRDEPAETPSVEVAAETVEGDPAVWIADDAVVAGAPVLEELSDADLAALLEEMGG